MKQRHATSELSAALLRHPIYNPPFSLAPALHFLTPGARCSILTAKEQLKPKCLANLIH